MRSLRASTGLAHVVALPGDQATAAAWAAAGADEVHIPIDAVTAGDRIRWDLEQPLTSEPWGARTFIVRDPDDNLVLFAGHGD